MGGGGGGGESPITGGRDLGNALPGAQGQCQEHQRWSLLAVKEIGQEQSWAVGPWWCPVDSVSIPPSSRRIAWPPQFLGPPGCPALRVLRLGGVSACMFSRMGPSCPDSSPPCRCFAGCLTSFHRLSWTLLKGDAERRPQSCPKVSGEEPWRASASEPLLVSQLSASVWFHFSSQNAIALWLVRCFP